MFLFYSEYTIPCSLALGEFGTAKKFSDLSNFNWIKIWPKKPSDFSNFYWIIDQKQQ